jgi:serine protease Do
MKRWTLILACLVLGGLIGTTLTSSWLRGQPQPPVVLPKELTSYRDVVKRVLPGVVSIESKMVAKKQLMSDVRPPLDNKQMPEEFRRFFEQMPAIPHTEEPEAMGFGSGFIVDPKGVILTNFHVVDHADQVVVTLADGRKFPSKDVKVDAKTDLAIIRIDAKEPLPFLELGDSTSMEIGDRVLAVGAPFGLAGSVTHGIISAKGRNLNLNQYEDFLQTDAAINPGNSGGPLVSLDGKVIGINAAIKSRSGGFQGVGMAISSNLARNVMDQLLANGVVKRGYLGVQIKDVDNADLAAKLGLKDKQGVVVTQVYDNTPASKAGLKDGDVIVSLNGQAVKDGHTLQTTVASLPLGKPVALNILRDAVAKDLQVTIEEQPDRFGNSRVPAQRARHEEAASLNLDKVGVEVADLTADMAKEYGFREDAKGVVITNVERSGLAATAGLRRGMLITKLDRQPVATAAKLKDQLEHASLKEGVLLQVQSPAGGTSYVVIKSS